jgi:exopolysaccharide production protein ExoY
MRTNFALTQLRPDTASTPSISRFVKRAIDLIAAPLGLIVLSPLFLVLAVLISLDGGPAFYSHRRIGANGQPFKCIKFRTMILDAEECLEEYLYYHPEARAEWLCDQKLDRDPRITAIGTLLRKSSLDELPQLINVIRGEMTLVGPRPVTESELSRYGNRASAYTSVRPGITGLWQVSGRSSSDYATRVALDERYAKEWSIGLDLWILYRTPSVVLSLRGAK